MSVQVYLDPCTVNSRKVLAGLEYLGTAYQFNHVDYFAGAHKSPEYMKINPHATVPAMTHDDLTITESNAILQYCADIGQHAAYPSDPKQRASANRWLLWEASAWFPSCYTYLVEYVVKPLLNAEPDQKIIDEAAPRWHSLAKILDDQLAKTKWISSNDAPTIADFAIAAPMHLHAAQRLPLDQHPNLKRWMTQGIEQIPAWIKTQPAVDRALLPAGAAGAASMVADTQAAAMQTDNAVANGVNGHTSCGDQLVTGEVHARVNYSKEVPARPTELYFYETEKAKDVHEPGDDEQMIRVQDGRGKEDKFKLDTHGFEVRPFTSAYNDWENEDAVRKSFYPEVVSFLKDKIGAREVLVFDHTIRTVKNSGKKLTQETNTSQRSPVMLVHCDYTHESAPIRVRQLLGDRADELLSRRVAFLNVWKPIHHRVESRPLAMADVNSTPMSDFFKLHLRYRERDGENYVLKYSKDHSWWYFSGMTTEEVIILKTYESEADGRARFVGHTAFEDGGRGRERESVEIRTIAFF